MSSCPGHFAHWFTVSARVAGGTGLRAPICQRCGAPNPRTLNDDELSEYRDVVGGNPDEPTAGEINACIADLGAA